MYDGSDGCLLASTVAISLILTRVYVCVCVCVAHVRAPAYTRVYIYVHWYVRACVFCFDLPVKVYDRSW